MVIASEMVRFEDETLFSPLQIEIVELLNKNGPMTRAELVNAINKPRTTIYDNLMGLMAHNIVKKYSRPTNYIGRPLVFFKIVETSN